ncbi:ATP-binding protein [Streptomyces lunaelactis]|uniref:ATP-binding protein n=1 Tax=Streptomyces lunaelactis TaxID=1535768 RepID=UPI00158466A5|nr:ATP-binding protein [Streptomyces lunaelactis]NUK02873.1 ATP-binding protein [Streptomyces lunaelactis]NUK07968.1 ATP-binding protein [Streptomyces lunaelactis]NUK17028.1 ATP-binding protein [Streptomyces lunaelactis]NUK73786.1 ATP-binding protein [Streptomyces lunaelactis]NUK76597.1 ATP-binding protein [Streptomyces lunaelactis]
MKQSAARTLGVAALGAAFAAAAAGTASAAPASFPGSVTSLDTVTDAVPVQEALTKLPAGAPESLAGGRTVLTNNATTLPAPLQETASKVLPAADKADPLSGLLGGLPLGGALPVGGGLPVGAGLPGLG